MKNLLAVLVLLAAALHANEERLLHVSAWPPNSEVYVGEEQPDYSNEPDYVTPASVKVPRADSSVRITLFKQNFNDTTIEVKLPKLDEAHLMVIMNEETDPEIVARQERALARRTHKKIGAAMMLASIVPFGVAAVTAVKNELANSDAEDLKKELSKHKIESEETSRLKEKLGDRRKAARTYRNATFGCLGAGAAILGVGFYIWF